MRFHHSLLIRYVDVVSMTAENPVMFLSMYGAKYCVSRVIIFKKKKIHDIHGTKKHISIVCLGDTKPCKHLVLLLLNLKSSRNFPLVPKWQMSQARKLFSLLNFTLHSDTGTRVLPKGHINRPEVFLCASTYNTDSRDSQSPSPRAIS